MVWTNKDSREAFEIGFRKGVKDVKKQEQELFEKDPRAYIKMRARQGGRGLV